MTWEEALAAWELDLSEGHAPSTVKAYLTHVGSLAATVKPDHPDPWTLPGWAVSGWLVSHNWSPETRRKRLAPVRTFYRWAADVGLCSASPLAAEAEATPVALTPWAATLAAWHPRLAECRAPSTVETYLRHLEWLALDLADAHPDPWTLPPVAVSGWLADHNWSTETQRKILVSLRAFYGWGINEGLCRRSPLAGLAAPPKRRRGPARLKPSPLWAEPVEGYLTHLAAGARRASTIQLRSWWLIRLSETYADPWTVTTADLAVWLARADWAPETKRLGLSSVRGFYTWAEDSRLVDRSPARGLAPVARPRALPRPAPDAALRHGLDLADDRTRLALQIAAYAGLRCAEVAGLHTADLHDEHLHITGKGQRERLVPLHPELKAILSTELRRRYTGTNIGTGWGRTVPPPDGWLFPGGDDATLPITSKHLGKLMSRALPAGWSAHSLRHRFATEAYKTTRDLRAVQELLGHSKPETTARYAAIPDTALQAAVAGVGLL